MNYTGILWRGILAIVLGVIMVLWPDAALSYIVMILGIVLIVSGAMSLVAYAVDRRRSDTVIAGIPYGSIFALILGIILAARPAFFVSILMFLLGALLVVAGLGQIAMYNKAYKLRGRVPFVYYVFPLLILLAGVVILFNPFASATGLFVFFGIFAIVYGIVELFSVYNLRRLG